MLKPVGDDPPARVPLTRERVLRRAVAIADAGGLPALTIRSLAKELGVEPMSVYYHVAGKEQILDGIIDLIVSEIDLPPAAGHWRSEIRQRATSARHVLRRHSWAIALMASRTTPGPATLRHHDAMFGRLRLAGFSVEMTAHAYALIDSYVYGFALQEAALPFKGTDAPAKEFEPITQRFPADEYPHVVEMATEYLLKPGYDFGGEFEPGLDVILDALSRSVSGEGGTPLPSGRAKRQQAQPPHLKRSRQPAHSPLEFGQ